MDSSVGLHSQLANIMDALAKAAVADICKLVDEGYAVLRLEASRRHKENQRLRKRLQVLELMVQRGCAAPDHDQFLATARPTGCQPGPNFWREKDLAPQDKFAEETKQFELHLIKEERLEDDLQQGDLQEAPGRSGVVKFVTVDDGQAPSASEDREKQHSVWDNNGMDTMVKAESASEAVKQRPQLSTSDCSAGQMNSLPFEYVTYGGASQAETFGDRLSVEADGQEAPDLDCLHQRPFPVTGVSGSSFPPLESGNMKALSAGLSSVPREAESEVRSTWEKETVSETVYTQHRRYQVQKNMVQFQQENVNGEPANQRDTMAESQCFSVLDVVDYVPYSEADNPPRIPKASHKLGTKEKRFTCTYCGKSFSCPNHLKTHRRIHTGEKPFSCNQCGKRFSDSSNVKRHQNTHTGNKPFICTLCGRGFSQSGCLITHQRVHTGEKPFSCAQCGKRFSDSSNLKRHQNTHVGKKGCSCLH